MLLINKSQTTSRFIVTVSETSSVSPYTLVIDSAFDNKTVIVAMGANYSQHPNRYDEFYIPNSSFTNMLDGRYIYSIVDSLDKLVEKGILMVVDNQMTEEEEVSNEFTFLIPSSTDDDYVVYNGN